MAFKRAGVVQTNNFDFSVEKISGILHTESYTEEDWEKYGDNIVLAKVDSDE